MLVSSLTTLLLTTASAYVDVPAVDSFSAYGDATKAAVSGIEPMSFASLAKDFSPERWPQTNDTDLPIQYMLASGSPGDLTTHLPYYPSLHGYYYFRLYSLNYLRQQQAAAARWGGDPRNPFAVDFLERAQQEYAPRDTPLPPEVIPPPSPHFPAPSANPRPY